MSARRGESGLSGILLVDKPQGLTSHDVVNRVRRTTGERRVGHAGTLDPMATGLLVVLVGPATRLAPYLTAAEKTYTARIAFGTETNTDDAEGEVVRTCDVPASIVEPVAAAAVVAGLVGIHEQVPPAFSAIKRGGVTAYEAARKGEALEIEPRAVEIRRARLLQVDAADASWEVELDVSKGTYIRAIARDLGRSLGAAAHLSALRRTRSGSLHVTGAVPLASLESATNPRDVAARFVDPLTAMGLPAVEVGEAGALRVSAGSTLDASSHCTSSCPERGEVAIASGGLLLAVYAVSEGTLRAATVIPGGVRGGER